jgi:hypothetical protein
MRTHGDGILSAETHLNPKVRNSSRKTGRAAIAAPGSFRGGTIDAPILVCGRTQERAADRRDHRLLRCFADDVYASELDRLGGIVTRLIEKKAGEPRRRVGEFSLASR